MAKKGDVFRNYFPSFFSIGIPIMEVAMRIEASVNNAKK
jgi:hypothetical protein